MVRVAIDVMGGDHAPLEIIRGAVAAVSANHDLQVILVGREEQVEQCLNELNCPRERISLVPAADVIQNDDDPGLAVRNKQGSSMVTALQLVRSGQAEAALSAGNTGALMTAGVLFLGRLSGVSRPALLAVMPGFKGEPVLVLDVGANMDARPEQMLQYAFMGSIYARKLLGRKAPRVALLNVGIEHNKGNSQAKKAYSLFKRYIPEFYGNIEGTEVFFNSADVIICDGFVGNVLLKVSEGLSRGILGFLVRENGSSLRLQLGAALLKPVLRDLSRKVDVREYGGAPLLGVNGVCIKCHGSSRARAIELALLKQVYPFVRLNLVNL
ncbi:MAG TPA: phosphate acyltransferase PlsX, partial [Firmicutes bacterium]|nr:phosphate acyltransferase PlsX [Bacillota bacterium]